MSTTSKSSFFISRSFLFATIYLCLSRSLSFDDEMKSSSMNAYQYTAVLAQHNSACCAVYLHIS